MSAKKKLIDTFDLPIYVAGEPIPEDLKIVALLARDGVYVQSTVKAYGREMFTVTGRTEEYDFPEAAECKNGLVLNVPKIQNSEFNKTMAFFRWVYNTHHSEAICLMYLNPERGIWSLVPPPQKGGPAAVKYDATDTRIPPGWFMAGTIHSHAGMKAFHSGTDREDEWDTNGFHVTTSCVDDGIAASVVTGRWRFSIKPEELIDLGGNVFPEEWKQRFMRLGGSYGFGGGGLSFFKKSDKDDGWKRTGHGKSTKRYGGNGKK